MKQEITNAELKKALINPASVFTNPAAIVAAEGMSVEQKVEILKRWEYDAVEIQVAEEEGFPPKETKTKLDDILEALHQLNAGPNVEQSPPTKQHGV